jgi:hypothetical protein
MTHEEERLPDLEVVLTCNKCAMTHTPYTSDQIVLHCVQCGAATNLRSTPPALDAFRTSVAALLTEAFKTTALSRALKTATAKSEEAQTLLTVSIRARKV